MKRRGFLKALGAIVATPTAVIAAPVPFNPAVISEIGLVSGASADKVGRGMSSSIYMVDENTIFSGAYNRALNQSVDWDSMIFPPLTFPPAKHFP